MVRIVIAEDDRLTARTFEHYCKEVFDPEPIAIKLFDALLPALYYIRENPIDLLILDINLRGEVGFDILEIPEKDSFFTIVTSSDAGNAVRSFDYGVLDFVAKPFTRERFVAAIERMRRAEPGRARGEQKNSLSVKKDGMIELVRYRDILYLQSEGNFTDIFCKNARTERLRRTMDALEADLTSDFFRSHRSCIINLTEVRRILRGPNNTYRVAVGEYEVPLSRSRYNILKKILNDPG